MDVSECGVRHVREPEKKTPLTDIHENSYEFLVIDGDFQTRKLSVQ